MMILYIFIEKKENIKAYNNRKIINIRNPITLVKSKNIGRALLMSN